MGQPVAGFRGEYIALQCNSPTLYDLEFSNSSGFVEVGVELEGKFEAHRKWIFWFIDYLNVE